MKKPEDFLMQHIKERCYYPDSNINMVDEKGALAALKAMREDAEKELIAIRQSLADYMYSEGCGCCQNVDEHEKVAGELAALLKVPAYDDNSGYDFYKFRTKGPIQK